MQPLLLWSCLHWMQLAEKKNGVLKTPENDNGTARIGGWYTGKMALIQGSFSVQVTGYMLLMLKQVNP